MIWANQFDNTAITRHYDSTGPEIRNKQMAKLTALFVLLGQRTLAGVGRLKDQNAAVKIPRHPAISIAPCTKTVN